MSDFFPNEINTFINWFKLFTNGIKKHHDVYHVSGEEADRLCSLHEELAEAVQQVNSAKIAYKSAVQHKKDKKNQAVKEMRKVARMIHIYKDIPPAKLNLIGLSKHKTSQLLLIPKQPGKLIVSTKTPTSNLLVWDANGNKRHAMYVIEASIGDTRTFRLVGSTFATRWNHANQKAGVPIYYRIYAKRRSRKSSYSNIAGVYL
jgi:hypothetical protein